MQRCQNMQACQHAASAFSSAVLCINISSERNMRTPSVYLKFESCSSIGYGGVGQQSLQSWTALTAAQLPLLIRGGGGQTAVTAKLNCTHCSPTSTSDSGGGVRLQSLQSWTALTSDQLHFSPTSTPGGGGGGGSDCSHCKVELHSLQPNFHFWFWGEGQTAVTAKLNCTHFRSASLQPNFNSWGGGLDCSHCKVELHSLQPNFHFWFWGGQTAVIAKLNCTHCSPTSTYDSGGGQTAVTAKLNCTHFRSASLQPNFNSWGGSDCSHCKVELHSLQINFTSAQLQLLGGIYKKYCVSGSFVTLHVHFVHNHEISVSPSHSVWSTGWPLVLLKLIRLGTVPKEWTLFGWSNVSAHFSNQGWGWHLTDYRWELHLETTVQYQEQRFRNDTFSGKAVFMNNTF